MRASEFFAVGKPNEGPCNVLTQCCCPCGKPLGNMVVLAESRAANGEIRLDCVVGPFWPVMLFVTFPLVVGISLIVAVTCLPALNPGFAVGMVVLMLATAIALGKTATTDPGILHRRAPRHSLCRRTALPSHRHRRSHHGDPRQPAEIGLELQHRVPADHADQFRKSAWPRAGEVRP